jgi:D-alanine-D-alanine ligase
MDEELMPPDDLSGFSEEEVLNWKAEYDVVVTLGELDQHVLQLGVSNDLGVIRNALLEFKPHIAFNMLEEFHGVAIYDQHVASYLELMRQPYTGCNPRGLMLAHDKALCKKLLTFHRIRTPDFIVFPRGRVVRRPRRLEFPLLVKSVSEEASFGITKDSLVYDDESLIERVSFVHDEVETDALVEEYIEGRELYVGVMGNRRLRTFPTWEMLFKNIPDDIPNIATARVKWDPTYQKKLGIVTQAAKDLPEGADEKIAKLCKRVYRVLCLSGYARMDLRMKDDGAVYVLEANPNPNIAYGEDFAESAETVGISYSQLIQKIIYAGMKYQPEWRA